MDKMHDEIKAFARHASLLSAMNLDSDKFPKLLRTRLWKLQASNGFYFSCWAAFTSNSKVSHVWLSL